MTDAQTVTLKSLSCWEARPELGCTCCGGTYDPPFSSGCACTCLQMCLCVSVWGRGNSATCAKSVAMSKEENALKVVCEANDRLSVFLDGLEHQRRDTQAERQAEKHEANDSYSREAAIPRGGAVLYVIARIVFCACVSFIRFVQCILVIRVLAFHGNANTILWKFNPTACVTEVDTVGVELAA